jgi:hypothetical protein
MFSPFECHGQSILPHKPGSMELNTEYRTHKKPLWLIALKLLGSAAMIAVGGAIAIPSLLELEYPLWHAIGITAGGMCIYTAIAFFVRPDPNTDEITSGVNKFLWRLHCVLGPGRFTAETLLDVCAYVGLAGGQEVAAVEGHGEGPFAIRSAPLGAFDATQPIAPLDPNRFAQSSGNFVAGQIQLDSQRFFTSAVPTGGSPVKA